MISCVSDLKRAIKMLRRVKNSMVCKTEDIPNKVTERAIRELKEGKTVKCKDFEEYCQIKSI